MAYTQHFTIRSIIDQQAADRTDQIAIQGLDAPVLTYGALKLEVDRLVARLRDLGVERGQRVAIVLPNGVGMAVAFLATTAAATAAPLNPAYTIDEFKFYLSDLGVKAVIVEEQSRSPVVEVAQSLGVPIFSLKASAQSAAGIYSLETDAPLTPAQSDPVQPDDIALVLHTSGTTSRPKIVPLKQVNLCISAATIAQSLNLSPADSCLNVMPLFHIHGLVGALLSSLTAGGTVICTTGFMANRFFEWLGKHQPTWYTAVPTMHHAITMQASDYLDVLEQVSLRFIRSCSASLPPSLMENLEGIFSAPVVEAYGMTEASHQMAINPLPPRQRKAGSVGLATGVQIAILDQAGSPLPAHERGEIAIQGSSVMSGYESNPEANTAAFTNGWFRTGDEGYLDEEGYLFITGRIKEIINRGGEKISPREVDEVLLAHPAVGQCVAFAVPHPRLGEEIAAAVVLKQGSEVADTDLRYFATKSLAYFKVPRRIFFLDAIPKGPTGKIQRIGLAAKLEITDKDLIVTNREYVPPTTPLELSVVRILSGLVGAQRLSVNCSWEELGLDSVIVAMAAARLGAELGIEIDPADLFVAPSLAHFAADLQDRIAQAAAKPV